MTECHCPACGCIHEPGCTPLAAAEALSRLTASPLPEEIAKLCERLTSPDTILVDALRFEAAIALHQQAQRIERQRINLVNCAAKMREDSARIAELEAVATTKGALGILKDQLGTIVNLRARIAELEDSCAEWITTAHNIQVDVDSIRAKMIEECAAFTQRAAFFEGKHDAKIALIDMANSIRALNQPEAGATDDQNPAS